MLGKGVLRLGGLLTIGRLLQIASALVLIKLLTPSQMGAVGILTAIFIGVYSLSNLGFDRYLIRADDADVTPATVNVIWTLQIIRGLFVFIVCLIMAFGVQAVSDFDREIIPQIVIIGLALLVNSMANPEISLFERNNCFKQIGNCRGMSMACGAVVVTITAFATKSPWAYVLGQLTNTLVYVILSFYYSEHRPCLSYNTVIVKKVFKYCKHLFVIAVVSVIATQFENYYIAFAFGAETLGFYFTWARLVYMPRELIAQISDKVVFAKACIAKRTKTGLVKEHLLICLLAVMIILPFYALIWFYGEWFISFVAGDEWVSYHWVGKFFVVISSTWLTALLFSPIVLAHYPEISSILRSVEVFIMITLMLWLGRTYGVKGILIASLTGILVATSVRLYIVYRYVFRDVWYKHFLAFTAVIGLGLGIFTVFHLYGFFPIASSRPGFAFAFCSILFWVLAGGITFTMYRANDTGGEIC